MTTAAFWGVSRHLLQEEIQSFPTVPQSMAKAKRNTVIGTPVFGEPLSLFGKRVAKTLFPSGASVSSASKKRKADGEVGKTVAKRKSAAPVDLKGFDSQGNKLVHDIQAIFRLKTTLNGHNKVATCSVCKSGNATNYCTGCTDRAGGKIIAVCGTGSGRSCIGRHFRGVDGSLVRRP